MTTCGPIFNYAIFAAYERCSPNLRTVTGKTLYLFGLSTHGGLLFGPIRFRSLCFWIFYSWGFTFFGAILFVHSVALTSRKTKTDFNKLICPVLTNKNDTMEKYLNSHAELNKVSKYFSLCHFFRQNRANQLAQVS